MSLSMGIKLIIQIFRRYFGREGFGFGVGGGGFSPFPLATPLCPVVQLSSCPANFTDVI